MRWRDKDLLLIWLVIILLAFSGAAITSATAQSICGPTVPSFNVNLAGNPGGTWTSNPPIPRGGLCCNAVAPDKCVEFVVTLDVNAIGINFQIASGAVPPGALYYQVDCGPMVPVGSPICLSGPGPYRITFCKPGSNINTYSITSIPRPAVSPTTTTSDGCNIKIGASGLVESTVTWTSIAPGSQGQYNSYLACTTGCDTVLVTPQTGYPAFVDYKVCGTPLGGVCSTGSSYCDTVRVYFVPPIANSISPNPASYCVNNPGVTLNAVINGGSMPYTYIWKNSAGIVVGGNSTYFATSPGNYVLEVQDATYPGCPSKLSSVTVTVDPMPSVSAGPDRTVCPGNPTVSLSGSVTNATGGIWSGGSGTFSPSPTALNATYTPTTSEIASGIVVLTLTSTGMGSCAPVSDQMTINITQPLNVNAIMPQIICFGETANITASVTGGTAPYQYSWNNGSTNQSIYNVVPGTYTVAVTDATANSCTISKTFVLNQNAPLSLTVPSTNVITCDSSVYVNVSATGGSGNFSYMWNTGATTPGITVNSGTYIITATDSLGCSVKDTVVIQAAGTAINATVNQPSTLCFNGTATLFANATGGFGGYQYTWNSGQSTQSITVPTGNYCVTVEDTVGCLYTRCVQVSQAPQLLVNIPTPGLICFGATTTVTASVSGGTPPYSYQWNTGESTASITKPAGTYSVTVTDANSNVCTATASVTINQSADLSLNFSSVPVSCFGGNNGSATVTVTGGTQPYNYAWNPYGGNSTTAYLLSAGTYTVNVYDNNGCSKSGSVTITQPPLLNATVTSVNNVQCAGNQNGSATVVANGGSPTYTYLWSPSGETNSTANSLAAGGNTVVIQDSKGCTKSLSINITEPSPLVSAIASSTNVSCNGGNDGTASVIASGGTSPYSYTWLETGDNTATVSNLYYGNYNISIQDAAGCVTTTTVSIQQPPALSSTISSTSNVSCFGASNGSATVTATGGSPGYNYSWSNGAGSNPTASNLQPGAYTVTVTDIEGCTTSSSVLITQPSPLTFAQASATPATCAGLCNGTVTATASGGTGPYQFLWTPGNYTSSSVSNLCAGVYNVRITDQNGCFRDTSLQVTEPLPLQVAATVSGSNCSQPNGSATATVTGGTQGYTYSWSTSPVQTASVASGLTPGTYTLKVTDNNGCITTIQAGIQNIPGVTASAGTTSNVTCNSQCNGSASVTLSGGTSPYTYSWSTIPAQTTQIASNLCAGSYIVKVTGADGCSDTATVTITQPQSLVLSQASVTQVYCYGDSTGSASVLATGGSGSFSYLWSTNPSQNGPTATNLPAGFYVATVTDANSCTDTLHVQIVQPPSALQLTVSHNNINCNGGNTGSAVATVSGGSPSYTYSWNSIPSQNTPSASNLTAGTYSVLVTDSKGCRTSSSPVIITQPASALQAIINQSNVACFGNNSGSSQAVVSGGTSPYTYSWSTTPTQNGPSAINLSAGSYSVTISDALGCNYNSPVIEITQPIAPLEVSVTSTDINCYGTSTGTAEANASGGTFPYTYNWSTTPTQSTASVSSLSVGTYTLVVTDNNGCSYTNNSVVIGQPSAPLQVSVTNTNVNCYGGSNATATAVVTGGSAGYNYSWSCIPTQSTPQASGLSAGTYSVSITDQNNCSITSVPVVITQPQAPLTLSITPQNVTCFGSSNGSIQAVVTGGTSSYTYSWSTTPVQTGPTAGNLSAGTYGVNITDAKGCVASASSIQITQPSAPLTASVASTNVSCNGGANGTATASVSGGTAPYTYSWNSSPAQTTAVANTLAAGTYLVTVTDANGCQYAPQPVTITQPSQPLSSSIATSPVSCYGDNSGSAYATVTGGTQPYTYSWSTVPSQTAAQATLLYSGTYTFSVTDANGCTLASQQAVISQPVAALSISTSKTEILCFGQNTGAVSATATGGSSPYTYSWNTTPPQTTSGLNNLGAGYYTVNVTDSRGCTFTSNPIQVMAPMAALTTSATATDVSCFGSSDGTAMVTVNGGTLPYSYSWSTSPSQATPNATGLQAGNYFVKITDANGCTVTSSTVTVSQPAELVAVISNTTSPACSSNNGSATVNVSGGTGPYYYSWNTSPSQTLATASNLGAGNYMALVTDMRGCKDSVNVTLTQPQTVYLVSAGAFPTTCNESCDGYAVVIAGGGSGPYSYSWSNGGSGTAINNVCEGYYTVYVYDNLGCYTDTVLHVTSPDPILLSSTVTPANCYQNNGSATVTPSGGMAAYSYSWSSTPPSFGATLNGVTPGNYSVTVTDARGCQSSMQVNVPNLPGVQLTSSTVVNALCKDSCDGTATVTASSGTAPYTYFWNTTPPQFLSTAEGLCAGTYKATVRDDDGCWDTLSVVVNEPDYIVAASTDTSTICIGQSATLNATAEGGNGQYSYNWDYGTAFTQTYTVTPVQTTSYTLLITDTNGCRSQILSIPVNVYAPLTIETITGDSICPGSIGSVSASITGGDGNYTYMWTPGNIATPGFQASPSETTNYTLTVKDACGSPMVKDSVSITVLGLPQISFTPDARSGCKPLCVKFDNTSTVSSGNISSWNWSFSNGMQSNDENPSVCFNEDGSCGLYVEAVSNYGCRSTISFDNYIQVHPDPVADFLLGPQPADILNPLIQFTDNSSGAVEWHWTFNDRFGDKYSTERNPVYSYSDTGSFCPVLKVTNEFGCISEKESCLEIEPEFSFYIPNAFSPNGDGYNETFSGKGTLVHQYEMMIFDRWGNLVYQTEDLDKPWDGRANGGSSEAQQDVYVYKIKVWDQNRRIHDYYGNVTLVK